MAHTFFRIYLCIFVKDTFTRESCVKLKHITWIVFSIIWFITSWRRAMTIWETSLTLAAASATALLAIMSAFRLPGPQIAERLIKLSRTISNSSGTRPMLPHIFAWIEGYICKIRRELKQRMILKLLIQVIHKMTLSELSFQTDCHHYLFLIDSECYELVEDEFHFQLLMFILTAEAREILKPRRHVFQAEMLHLNTRFAEAFNALF